MPDPKQPEPHQSKPQDVIDILFVVSYTLAGCITPILHAKPGTHAFMWAGPFAAVLMFFWAGVGELPELLLYLPVWFVFVVFRRITANRNAHSRYMGYPWIVLRLLPFLPEWLAIMLEGVLIAGTGILIRNVYPALGFFVTACGVGLLVKEAINREAYRARVRQMRDGQIDHQWMAESFRR